MFFLILESSLEVEKCWFTVTLTRDPCKHFTFSFLGIYQNTTVNNFNTNINSSNTFIEVFLTNTLVFQDI